MSDERNSVLTLLLVGFVVYTFGHDPKSNSLPDGSQLAAWAILALIFGIGVDVDPSGEVMASLALLMLVTILLRYGPTVFDKINGRVTSKPTVVPHGAVPNP